MANNNKLKAYARYDGSGRIIPGSNVLRRSIPKVGNWKEIPAYECCDPSFPTTTSTTTVVDTCVRMTVLADEENLEFSVGIGASEEGVIVEINWGDGNIEFAPIVTPSGDEGDLFDRIFHEYESPGTYEVSVCANFPELVNLLIIDIND
jgi:hypothetical protein